MLKRMKPVMGQKNKRFHCIWHCQAMQWCGCWDCLISCQAYQVFISFLEIWTTRCLQLLLVILRIMHAYLAWIDGCLGNYLAMVRQDMQDMLHRCQPCIEIRGGYILKMWVHLKTIGQKIILPIINKGSLDNLQWSLKLLNAISVCHV